MCRWKAKESTWPALSKMAKQYLAAPASSAGVERVFSAAGKMHGDLRQMKSGRGGAGRGASAGGRGWRGRGKVIRGRGRY